MTKIFENISKQNFEEYLKLVEVNHTKFKVNRVNKQKAVLINQVTKLKIIIEL